MEMSTPDSMCYLCRIVFDSVGKMKLHTRWHSTKRTWKCEKCPRAFHFRWSLVIHKRVYHTSEKPLKRDMWTHSVVKPELPEDFTAQVGDKGIEESEKESCAMDFSCSSVQTDSVSEIKVEAVEDDAARESSAADCPSSVQSVSNSENTTETKKRKAYRPYQCDKCQRRFFQRYHLASHVRVHSHYPFKCNRCGKLSLSYQKMRKHELAHRNEEFLNCSDCGGKFANRGDLERHECQNRHTTSRHTVVSTNQPYDLQEKPFRCGECQRTFTKKCHLGSHLRVHNSDNAFKCGVCGSPSSNMDGMHKHIKRMHGERDAVGYTQGGHGFIYRDGLVYYDVPTKQHLPTFETPPSTEKQVCYDAVATEEPNSATSHDTVPKNSPTLELPPGTDVQLKEEQTYDVSVEQDKETNIPNEAPSLFQASDHEMNNEETMEPVQIEKEDTDVNNQLNEVSFEEVESFAIPPPAKISATVELNPTTTSTATNIYSEAAVAASTPIRTNSKPTLRNFGIVIPRIDKLIPAHSPVQVESELQADEPLGAFGGDHAPTLKQLLEKLPPLLPLAKVPSESNTIDSSANELRPRAAGSKPHNANVPNSWRMPPDAERLTYYIIADSPEVYMDPTEGHFKDLWQRALPVIHILINTEIVPTLIDVALDSSIAPQNAFPSCWKMDKCKRLEIRWIVDCPEHSEGLFNVPLSMKRREGGYMDRNVLFNYHSNLHLCCPVIGQDFLHHFNIAYLPKCHTLLLMDKLTEIVYEFQVAAWVQVTEIVRRTFTGYVRVGSRAFIEKLYTRRRRKDGRPVPRIDKASAEQTPTFIQSEKLISFPSCTTKSKSGWWKVPPKYLSCYKSEIVSKFLGQMGIEMRSKD